MAIAAAAARLSPTTAYPGSVQVASREPPVARKWVSPSARAAPESFVSVLRRLLRLACRVVGGDHMKETRSAAVDGAGTDSTRRCPVAPTLAAYATSAADGKASPVAGRGYRATKAAAPGAGALGGRPLVIVAPVNEHAPRSARRHRHHYLWRTTVNIDLVNQRFLDLFGIPLTCRTASTDCCARQSSRLTLSGSGRIHSRWSTYSLPVRSSRAARACRRSGVVGLRARAATGSVDRPPLGYRVPRQWRFGEPMT
jgi:hypothetical protein